MKRKIFFKSCGVKICAMLNEPSKRKLKDYAIIMLHGFANRKTNQKISWLSPRLNRFGISTFAIDFYGHGESGGDFSSINLTKALSNAEDAIEYLKKIGYRRFAFYGSSFGGAVALLVTSKSECIKNVSVACPVVKFNIAFFKKFYPEVDSKQFAADVAKYSMKDIAKRIKVPAMIIQGDKDDITPISLTRGLFSALGGEKCMVTIKGADHRFSGKKQKMEMFHASLNALKWHLPKH
jgi:esterase/lipase